jgi:hypothetical protein
MAKAFMVFDRVKRIGFGQLNLGMGLLALGVAGMQKWRLGNAQGRLGWIDKRQPKSAY